MTYFTIPMTSTLPTNGLRRELDRLFDDSFAKRAPSAFVPPVDIREDASAFTIDVDLPGVAAQSIEVLAEDGVLTIKGDKPARVAQEGERMLSAERRAGSFARQFRLPKTADASRISARYTDGQLAVRVEKVPVAQPRRVTVQIQAEPAAAPTTNA